MVDPIIVQSVILGLCLYTAIIVTVSWRNMSKQMDAHTTNVAVQVHRAKNSIIKIVDDNHAAVMMQLAPKVKQPRTRDYNGKFKSTSQKETAA